MTQPAVRFVLNGRPVQLTGRDALLPMSTLLRERLGLTGTKVVCAEGDCGACTVLLGRPAPAGDGVGTHITYRPVDSCILFAFQCHAAHVVTVEGLCPANPGEPTPLTVIQQALVDGHGSQCGFCTPGIVMALHGQCEQSDDEAPLNEDAARLALSGNLCRCTGYQQIFDSCSALAGGSIQKMAQRYDERDVLAMLDEVKQQGGATLHLDTPQISDAATASPSVNGEPLRRSSGADLPTRRVMLHLPATLEDALRFRGDHPGCLAIAGATDVGVWHNHGTPWPDHVLSITDLDELVHCKETDAVVCLGGGAPWDRLIDVLSPHYPTLIDILERLGSPQIRYLGTIAGNIANGSPIADILPFLFVADAEVELASATRGTRRVAIADFYTGYKQNVMEPDELIVAVMVPRPAATDRLHLEKVSKRNDMDISTFTAAIRLTMADDEETIERAAVAMGGVGPVVHRLPEVEAMLVGQPLSEALMREAGRSARQQITPISDVRGRADYRLQLAENVFVKAYHAMQLREAHA